jgi:hypothetical protein
LPTAPLLNGATISGTSTLYFVADQAFVTLPAATIAGQRLIIMGNNPGNPSFIGIRVGFGDFINDPTNNASNIFLQTARFVFQVVSDGNHYWWIYRE